MSQPSNLFYILMTVQLGIILGKWPTWCTILFYMFISVLYTFQATSCSSSGVSIVSIPAYRTVTYTDWHIPDVVLIQLILLMMSHEVARNM